MNAGNGHKVMLLVDADNVSADVMEQAVRGVIAEHGHLHVRRAYCTAEVALKHQQLFKRLSMRPMVNLAAGKNSTDIALAVDAMDLVMAERPQLVYLVSSDSDFAPLVNRLREKGCRVCGIGQQGKTGEETRAAYDHFIDLKHKGAGTAAAPADAPPARPARKAAAKKTGARRGDAAAPASEVDTVRA
ncbi:MAG: NYN domain-containing protein, partial [Bordetella sp.]|nr:NYN domain-containing protein [Pseudomonadota bacterium]